MDCPDCGGKGRTVLDGIEGDCYLCAGGGDARCELHEGMRSEAPLATEVRYIATAESRYVVRRCICAECDSKLRQLMRDTVPEHVWVRA